MKMATIIRADGNKVKVKPLRQLELDELEPGLGELRLDPPEPDPEPQKPPEEVGEKVEEEIRRRLEEAEAEAGRIVREAEERAAKLVEEAEAQAEEIRERAKAEGFETGFREGMKAAGEKLGELEKALLNALREVEGLKLRLAEEAERQLVELAMEIGRKLALKELSIDPGSVLRIARMAISTLDSTRVVLKVSPKSAELLRSHRAELMDALEGMEHVRVEVDGSLGDYDVVAESEERSVEILLSQREREIARALETAYEGDRSVQIQGGGLEG